MRYAGLLAVVCLLAGILSAGPALPREAGASPATIQDIQTGQLPREARETLAAIKRGGPFAYERDGVVFGNYERNLPARERGYYHEYTVPTPGARNRGARRIVAGRHAEYYYSDDHYRTFKRIRD